MELGSTHKWRRRMSDAGCRSWQVSIRGGQSLRVTECSVRHCGQVKGTETKDSTRAGKTSRISSL
ncbi:uncharacterized protein LOC127752201 isoform X2 [Frankliniella occidentalis]|uniref:Uncharacterized protein LOC127752201 isoform X2 n=1 Tax=Frankliniella occidentalis TaxID=133901 RepID=A0A9C6XBZ3_FRAOC|nr:uncharacterized protein LOC127752201 isoform X2 [Frankliniella occidentalis]